MVIKINENSKVANYLQLMNQIKEKIFSGELQENNQLPSIRSLAKELNIAIITIKRAYDELEKEGFIETRQGKGSYIKKLDIVKIKEMKQMDLMSELKQVAIHAHEFGFTNQEIIDVLKKVVEDSL